MPQTELTQPRWAQEIGRYPGVKPQFILWGNIHDIYPIQIGETITTLPLTPYLNQVLAKMNYDMVLRYEPLFGFSILHGKPDDFKLVSGIDIDSEEQKHGSLIKGVEIIDSIYHQKNLSVAIILSFASRINECACPQEKNEFFYRMFRLAIQSTPFISKRDSGSLPKHHLALWLLDKENDLPAWYLIDNPRIHVLPIPKPDHSVRKYVVDSCSRAISGFTDMSTEEIEEKKNIFLDQTGGMFASEIIAISQIARKEQISFAQVGEAIRRYKIGIVDNPWTKISRRTFEKAESMLSSRVIGQPKAIKRSVDVLKRSLFNLSGSQFSRLSQKPKGILFLAGPTGVGKTELAKSITELIFGTSSNYIRFDMSEFGHDHADQRLLGAPPGYVGYDVGGQLTNAVREKPFSLILFDEIEKGHPKILDIFLQILDDGRLTSGRGETVYFSESLIVFTSNLGMFETADNGERKQMLSPDMTYEEIEKSIMNSIENFFNNRLNRPEILNRIGRNIVVFDFIRPYIAEKICEKMLGNVLHKLAEEHKIQLSLAPETKKDIFSLCCADTSMGGRGIGNALEEYFVNPLSRALFAVNASQGSYRVVDAQFSTGEVELSLSRVDT